MRLLVTLLLLGTLLLEAKSYIRDYTYNASENDSKVSARKAALGQIQRLLIEEVGISVRSDFVKNEQLKDGAFSKTIQSRYKSFGFLGLRAFVSSKTL